MSKKVVVSILLIILSLTAIVSGASAQGNLYVIPIKGDITTAMEQYVAGEIQQALKDPKITGLIIDIDTYGGLIDAAVGISDAIVNAGVPTIAFVNTKAESAGVLITISADTIVMAPGATIGSAEPIPNTEKTLSYWAGQLRTVAQLKGRDEAVVQAMADVNVVIPGVSEEGRLLNLTTREAEELGFLDIIASDYQGITEKLSLTQSTLIVLEPSVKLKIAEFLTSPYVVPILLALGFIGLIFEVLTAGFGIGGTVGIISFALYFAGGIMVGNAGWAMMILFLAGLVLLMIEAFVPGFGITGLGGILCIIISIFLAANNALMAFTSLLIALILTVLAAFIILRFAPRNPHFKKFILSAEERVEKGYTSTKDKYDHLMGAIGVVKTLLRPVGTIEVNGELYEAVSEGAFIEAGTPVVVTKIEGRKIIVKESKTTNI